MNIDFASRKFILCAFVLAAGTVSMFTGYAKWAEILEMFKWILGFYMTANIAEHAVDKIGKPEQKQ